MIVRLMIIKWWIDCFLIFLTKGIKKRLQNKSRRYFAVTNSFQYV